MNVTHYCAQLRDLAVAYLAKRIGRVEYLTRRRALLDSIDDACNHPCNGMDRTQGMPDLDTTRPVYPKPRRD